MAETRGFKLDNSMIFQLIFAQAGSFAKAMLEVVQNSIDAKASKVEITFSPDGKGYIAQDDGVGFKTKDEVKDWFETVGFPHDIPEKQNADFARFGLGRCQQFSYAITKWRTNQFIFDVDVKANGLEYDLTELPEIDVKGCRIEGVFYEPQSALDLNNTIREVSELIAYASIPVLINGKQVNKLPQDQKWTHETEDAYIKIEPTNNLMSVYNLGVKVKDYWSGNLGSGGIIVSKKHFELNISRNEVLSNKCDIWKRLTKLIRDEAKDDSLKRPERLTNARRISLLSEWAGSSQEYGDAPREIKYMNTIPTMVGHVSIDKLERNTWTVAPDQWSSIGERLQRSKVAIVVSPEVLRWINATSNEDFAALITKSGSSAKNYVDFDTVSEGISGSHETVPKKMLTPKEVAVISACSKIGNCIYYHLIRTSNDYTYNNCQLRTIRAGSSDTADAWTDGKNSIWINVEVLKNASNNVANFNKLIRLIAHEYCHPEPSLSSHAHGFEFFELYHDLTIEMDMPSIEADALKKYCGYLRSKNVAVPVWAQRLLSKGVKFDEFQVFVEEDNHEPELESTGDKPDVDITENTKAA